MEAEGFYWKLLICGTHVQQQHRRQEGLSLAVTNLLVINRVRLQEGTQTQGTFHRELTEITPLQLVSPGGWRTSLTGEDQQIRLVGLGSFQVCNCVNVIRERRLLSVNLL